MAIKVGEAMVRAVVEIGDLRMPVQALTGDVDPAIVAVEARKLAPDYFDTQTNECRVSQHALLIEINGKRILVDPCVGHQRHRPAMPMFHMIESPLLERLGELGVTPESVDYVLCTHFHLDHVGWNTRLEDGRWVPTFPNARYQFSREEDAFWRRQLTEDIPGEEVHDGVYAECIAPVIEAGLADLIDPGATVAGCLTILDAAGHTVGQVAALLESEGEGLLLAGDLVHHPLQIACLGLRLVDHDRDRALATTRRLLDLCVDHDYWIAPAHFRAPHACKLRKQEGRYSLVWS